MAPRVAKLGDKLLEAMERIAKLEEANNDDSRHELTLSAFTPRVASSRVHWICRGVTGDQQERGPEADLHVGLPHGLRDRDLGRGQYRLKRKHHPNPFCPGCQGMARPTD